MEEKKAEKDLATFEAALLNVIMFFFLGVSHLRAGATFDWLFFDNSKVINFDD